MSKTSKTCNVCGESKELEFYYTSPDSDDMRMPVCRACCGCEWDTEEQRRTMWEEEAESKA